MGWLGKLIGALLGWMLFRHPLGVLFGLALGHLFDRGVVPGQAGGAAPRGFIEPLFAFLGALTKADGRVSEQEIAATEQLMARMRLDAEQRRLAIASFTAGKQNGYPAARAVADLRVWTQGRRDHAYILIDLVLDIVGAEGAPVPAKLQLLRQLAWTLHVHKREWIALAAMKGYGWAMGGADAGRGPRQQHAPPPRGQTAAAPDPWAVLGIAPDAGEREIKRAYRKLMSEHHPDKLGDVPDTLRQRAEERAREINAAYERIKAAKGFK